MDVELSELVRSLEDEWQSVLDEVLRPLSTKDVGRLAPRLEALSHAYNAGLAEGRRTKLPIEARIAFSFPRDVPKGAAAVRELVASRVLAVPEGRPLRVLDLGAGLGAMTWGIARALASIGKSGRIEALLVDEDPEVLAKAAAIARAARERVKPIEIAIETRAASVDRFAAARAYDVVVLGQVLSEIEPGEPAERRIALHAALVRRVLDEMVAPDGALVIVEPALRDRTRVLHAVRDLVLADAGVSVFAPCLHRQACPVLAVDGEWCHEDLEVDLPAWVVPLARAAGLRYQGLTFSYLVLRKDGQTMRSAGFRVVSNLLRSKGKAELVICGADGVRRKIRRLDRDAGKGPDPFLALRRGDVATVSEIDDRGRVQAGAQVRIDVGAARR
jgi:ribosomal protein RSM22 (predicted rRNA methylase)